MESEQNESFGVYKPVGHVVISFPTAAQADDAALALTGIGVADGEVRRYTDRQMLAQTRANIENASPLASIGQELNLIKAHHELAGRGYHFLVVHAPADELAQRVADTARAHGAERAQHFGHFIIEELIEQPDDLAQVGESPDRGLDAQTPSGDEGERAVRRPGEAG